MSNIVNNVSVSESATKQFAECGFIKIRGLFSKENLFRLRDLLESKYEKEQIQVEKIFSRINYDIGNEESLVEDVCRSPEFGRTMGALCGEQLIFAQGLYFEMEKGAAPGLGWHFGTTSFNYIMPSDMGYTLWIPFEEIDPAGQGGGLAFVSQQLYSAREDVKKRILVEDAWRSGRLDKSDFVEGQFGAFSKLFDSICQEDPFSLGDAIFFNRFVWHRSVPLKEGVLKKRGAYVMRFLSSKARYNLDLLKRNVEARKFTRFGERFADLSAGDLIASSKYAGKPIGALDRAG